MSTAAAEKSIRKSMICRGCWEVLRLPIFIRGPLAVPFRVADIGTSAMHPNTCTLCEKRFKGMMKAAQIRQSVTIVFADVRNYTSLSETTDPAEMTRLLGLFYSAAADAVWAEEGIVNKFIGDAVLAMFNFPFRRENHVSRAVAAALNLQRLWREVSQKDAALTGSSADSIKVGVGIHTGEAMIGEVGQSVRDFTVIGPVVNLAARIQSAALPGEVLVSHDVYDALDEVHGDVEERSLDLKGISEPVHAHVLSP